MLKRTLLTTIALLSITTPLMSVAANAWLLDKNRSSISFVTVKQIDNAENHVFKDFSGSISENFQAEIIIRPDSVDTIVPTRAIEFIQTRRQQRMRELLFETHLYPQIKINADVSVINELAVGESSIQSIPANLILHGVEQTIQLNIITTQASEDVRTVVSSLPVIVKSSDYNLDNGLLKLSALVGNIPLSKSVPVNFALTFIKTAANEAKQ